MGYIVAAICAVILFIMFSCCKIASDVDDRMGYL